MHNTIRHIGSTLLLLLTLVMMSAPAAACGLPAEPVQQYECMSHDPSAAPAPGDHAATQICKAQCVAMPATYAVDAVEIQVPALIVAVRTSRLSGIVLPLSDPPPRMAAEPVYSYYGEQS